MLALALAAAAQEAPKVPCPTCDGRGARDCKRHGKDGLELQVRHCSVAVECKVCGGTLEQDCTHCPNVAVAQALAERAAAAGKWLADRRARFDKHLTDKAILHGQSDHVDLLLTTYPLTVGQERLDQHRLLHLYLQRIEALRGDFMTVLGLDDRALAARLEVFMLEREVDHAALAPRVAGGGSNALGMKLMGVSAVYTMWHDKRTVPGDEEIHRTVIHNVTHLLLSNMQPEVWLGNRRHGWIDEGVAHWFEDRLTGRCNTFCYEEVGVEGGFKGGRWRVPLRKYAEANQLEPFPAVSRLNTDQLTGKQHAQAFAYVDFLISRYGGEKLAALVRLVKGGKDTRDALKEAIGLTMLELDPALIAWIKATYPLQEKQ